MSGKEVKKLFNNQGGSPGIMPPQHCIRLGHKLMTFESPRVMTILNLTPDSFYTRDFPEKSMNEILQQVESWLPYTDILDIGAVSTRPGANPVPEEEEMNRLLPVLKELHREFPDLPVSVDTFRSTVAEAALDAGAVMINDVSGGNLDPEMFSIIARKQVPYVLMHMQGTPQNMQQNPQYQNVTQDILFFFSQKIKELRDLHVHDIILDPGFGFGKTLEQNYRILHELEQFQTTGLPLLVGFSRKSMIQEALNIEAKDALNATTVLNTLALCKGASILRVHDPKEAMEACLLFRKTISE